MISKFVLLPPLWAWNRKLCIMLNKGQICLPKCNAYCCWTPVLTLNNLHRDNQASEYVSDCEAAPEVEILIKLILGKLGLKDNNDKLTTQAQRLANRNNS